MSCVNTADKQACRHSTCTSACTKNLTGSTNYKNTLGWSPSPICLTHKIISSSHSAFPNIFHNNFVVTTSYFSTYSYPMAFKNLRSSDNQYKKHTRVNMNSLIPDLCNASGSSDLLLPCLAWPGVNWKFSLLLLFFHLKYWPTFDIFTAYTQRTLTTLQVHQIFTL